MYLSICDINNGVLDCPFLDRTLHSSRHDPGPNHESSEAGVVLRYQTIGARSHVDNKGQGFKQNAIYSMSISFYQVPLHTLCTRASTVHEIHLHKLIGNCDEIMIA